MSNENKGENMANGVTDSIIPVVEETKSDDFCPIKGKICSWGPLFGVLFRYFRW